MFGIILRLGKAGYWTYKQVKVGSQAWKAAAKGSKIKGDDLGKLVDKAKKLKNNRNKKLKKSGTATKTVETTSKATKPWHTPAGKFKTLDKSAIAKLPRPQAKLYREAVKKNRLLEKQKTIIGLRNVAEGTANPIARATRKALLLPAHVSKTGGRLRGAGKLALRGGLAAELGYLGGTLLRSGDADKDKDRDASATANKVKTKATSTVDQTDDKRSGRTKALRSEAPPANADEKIEIAKSRHGKYSPQAGRALGAKHGIDVSYDFPGMSPGEYKKGLKAGTISKKLGRTDKEGKLTPQAKEELEERQMRRHGGSVSANNYKLRKKSSKKGSASKKSSWNY